MTEIQTIEDYLAEKNYVISAHVMTASPIDVNNVTYEGYTLKNKEAVLFVDWANLPNSEMYYNKDGRLELHPDYQGLAHMGFGKVIVSIIKDGAVAERWNILMDNGVETGIELNTEPDYSAVDERFKALDDKYLTPRVLAGLSTGDEYAQAQWAAHEAEAQALRDELAQAKAEAQ
jgi:hypothetical protein